MKKAILTVRNKLTGKTADLVFHYVRTDIDAWSIAEKVKRLVSTPVEITVRTEIEAVQKTYDMIKVD